MESLESLGQPKVDQVQQVQQVQASRALSRIPRDVGDNTAGRMVAIYGGEYHGKV